MGAARPGQRLTKPAGPDQHPSWGDAHDPGLRAVPWGGRKADHLMGRSVSFGDDFTGLFDWFTTRAFRLESLDQYAAGYEEEAVRRFLAGQPPRG